MNGLDLDKLKSQWTQETRKLDDSLTLDIEAVRSALAKKTTKAFRRHSYWLLASLVTSITAFLALMIFIVNHLNDSTYLLLATPLALFALAECAVQFLQWNALRKLDLSSPVVEVQEVLDRLRNRRLRLTKWIFLSSVLLWWPLIFVLIKGLTGFDIIPKFPVSFIVINAIIGFSFIPTAYLIARYFSNRFSGSPGFQKFLEEVAGKSWSQARKYMDAHQRFEDEVITQGDAKALQHYEKKNLLSQAANALLHSLKYRVLFSTIAYGVLILLTGVFNATHGGQWPFIVPGIVLNLFWVSQMVSGITHRVSLARLDLSLPYNELCDELKRLLDMRLILARIVFALTPIMGTALLQVLAKAAFGLDLIGSTPAYLLLALIPILIITVAVIYRKSSAGFVYAFANIMSFAAFKRSKMLIDLKTGSN